MRQLSRTALLLVGLALSFALGFAGTDLARGRLPEKGSLQKLLAPAQVKSAPSPTRVFRDAFNHIRKDYYRTVDSNELKYAGMEGLMAALGDPHTQFMEPKLASDFQKETKGKVDFVGVGARLLPDPLGAKVTSVFRDGPAAKAGVRPGDTVVSVDGKSMAGIEIDDIVSKIRGKEGTIVQLTVLRGNSTRTDVLSIKRAKVITPTADSFVIEDANVGYLAVFGFAESTTPQFVQALEDLDAKGIQGLIIDLRNNPGGLLETAVEMLSRFVDDKVVVTMRFRGGKEQSERTYGGLARDLGYPIVILINEESASAAEIFAGVMRDYRKATLVGEHTYGKASVQNVFMLIDGSSAKVTIARYYLPSGVDIARKVDDEGQYVSGGIKPDVLVPLSLSPKTLVGDPKTDNQIQRAMEIIKSKR